MNAIHPEQTLHNDAVRLLKTLIATPSISREEDRAAEVVVSFLQEAGIENIHRQGNNLWVYNRFFVPTLPTILLNSHIDTVPPCEGYSRDPFCPEEHDGRIYGLGSNDAGASVVSLIALFRFFYNQQGLRYNLCLALSAEEEVSGKNGIESILPLLGTVDFAIVGEPTQMQMAIAERGLIVLDCYAEGASGHAAREEGVNAIHKAIDDIAWFRNYRFDRVSDLLGPVKMSVTVIQGGTRHNLVPDRCSFTVDIRVNECYTNEQVIDLIRKHVACEVVPRSLRLTSSAIDRSHPIITTGNQMGISSFGSPTMSDQALLRVPSVKIGVGDSARSHTADEYIYRHEIEKGIDLYIALLSNIIKS